MTEKTKVPILTKIQNELKAPKNQVNNFGNYKYRNAEDIEQALKPLLLKYGAQLTFDEDYQTIGNRVYLVKIAHYKDSEQEVTVRGHAREPENKKGMDDSQVSGATSSYATKYALGALFLIDDTKDADSYDNRSNSNNQKSQSNQSNYSNGGNSYHKSSGGKKDVSKWSNDFLKKYKFKYGNSEFPMAELAEKVMVEGNAKTKKVVDGMQGTNAAVYQEIVKRGLFQEA